MFGAFVGGVVWTTFILSSLVVIDKSHKETQKLNENTREIENLKHVIANLQNQIQEKDRETNTYRKLALSFGTTAVVGTALYAVKELR